MEKPSKQEAAANVQKETAGLETLDGDLVLNTRIPLVYKTVRTIKFKRTHPDAATPARATDGSAGFDLTAVTRERVTNRLVKYGTGLVFEIPEGHVGLLFPRSSVYRTRHSLVNSVRVIDPDDRGEVSFVFRDTGCGQGREYDVGDRVGQLVVVSSPLFRMVEEDSLTDTHRGEGGYGSTGR